MNEKLRATVLELALPLIQAQGLKLWGLDITAGPTLRITLYVDSPAGSEDRPSIDQCETISRQLSLAMDVEDCIDQPWELEVSTPGLERRFFEFEQLEPYLGDILEVRLTTPMPGLNRKRWLGKLSNIGDRRFTIEPVSITSDGEARPEGTAPVAFDWDNVARAQRVHLFTVPKKPGKKTPAGKKQ